MIAALRGPSVRSLFAILAIFATLEAPAAAQENWPSFRGPDATNVAADDPRLPTTWSNTENVVWSREVRGLGWSSPIVWGDRVFLTSVWSEGEIEEPKKGLYFGGERGAPNDSHHWLVYCFRTADGSPCWEREVHSGVPSFSRHIKNTFASETPVTDGERLYAYFGNVGVFALTLDGEPVWEKRFEPVRTRFGWGTAASPIVHDGTLFIVNDNDDHSFLAALDAKAGAEKWRIDREEKSNWVTPFVWQNELRTELVTVGTTEARSYDLDGNLLWSIGNMSSIAIPQPFAAHGLLYIASGYVGDNNRPVYAVKPGGKGDISLAEGAKSNEHIVWFHPQAGPYNPTPLVYGDLYYTLFDRGFFTSHDAKTGAEVYDKHRLERGAGGFTVSPWAYNGRIFALNEDGDTYVIKAGPSFEIEGKNSLDEMCMATPAIADGSLYIRTLSKLYRLSNVKAAATASP
ncbi:MAG TPA: PQQ-binding-like beta-propeller repeat protein [Thermoanaerobaculia bacterium]|nr:PQQ-binding-like beta-propeller repeat protein [Thermoanaerobaculia bacterium]